MKSCLLLCLASVTLLSICSAASAQSGTKREAGFEIGGLPEPNPENDRRLWKSLKAMEQADSLLKQNQWEKAAELYKESIAIAPFRQAYCGLARCYVGTNDQAKAIEQYRLGVYIKSDKGITVVGYEPAPYELALLLSQSGLDEEAMFVYNRALAEVNYCDGKQDVKVLLPEFGLKPGQRTYITAHFQSMVHVAIAKTIHDDDKAFEHLKEAVSVYPKSGVAQFYLAERLSLTSREGARAAYEKAKQLDPKAIGQEADKAMTTGLFWRPSTEAPATPTTPTKSAPPTTP